jgi:hypothetical protein
LRLGGAARGAYCAPMSEILDLKAWADWFASLDREFVFLLALPFVVAVVGLWSWWAEQEDSERDEEERERQRDARQPHHSLR